MSWPASIVLTTGVTPPLSPTPPSSWWSPLSWLASSCKEVSPCRGRWMLGYCQACCKMCFTNIQTDCTQIRQDLCINWYHYHWSPETETALFCWCWSVCLEYVLPQSPGSPRSGGRTWLTRGHSWLNSTVVWDLQMISKSSSQPFHVELNYS